MFVNKDKYFSSTVDEERHLCYSLFEDQFFMTVHINYSIYHGDHLVQVNTRTVFNESLIS